jgi:hypothetical protein
MTTSLLMLSLAAGQPATSTLPSLTIGPGAGLFITGDLWQIDDATGVAGGSSSVPGQPDLGWTLLRINGNLSWTATVDRPFILTLETLAPTTTADNAVMGPMQHFDPTQFYSWPFAVWGGMYTGPTDPNVLDLTSRFEDTLFLNNLQGGAFSWAWTPGELDMTFTPIPEPSPLWMVILAVPFLVGRFRR